MVNPLIVKNAATAAAGAAKGATKIAMTEKAAKATAGAFKSIEETTKMGGFQSLESFSSNIAGVDPVVGALNYLMVQLSSQTVSSSVELMVSLISLISSPAIATVIDAAGLLVSNFIDRGTLIINIFTSMSEWMGSLDGSGWNNFVDWWDKNIMNIDTGDDDGGTMGTGVGPNWNQGPSGAQEF